MLFALFLAACEQEIPKYCPEMCVSAANLYGSCLQGWGTDWNAAGYEDRTDFLDSCETWAWEAQVLYTEEEVEGACQQRDENFSSKDCSVISGIDWSEPLSLIE